MRASGLIFAGMTVFFGVVTPAYWVLSEDPTGTTALVLTFGLTAMLAFYILFVANRLYARIGLVNAVFILPVTYLGGFILFAASFSLTTAVGVRLAQRVLLAGVANRLGGTPPEDRPDGEIYEAAGELGFFAPKSWSPLFVAGASSVVVLGLVFGWWLAIIGVALLVGALFAWVFEFYRGEWAR